MGDKKFDLGSLEYTIKKRKWILLAILIVVTGFGVYKTTKMIDTFTAKVKIFSGKTEEVTGTYSKGELAEYSSLMDTYINIIKTTKFMSEVSKKSGTNIPANQLIDSVIFETTEGIPILEIGYTTLDKETAKKIVKTISDEFSSGVAEIILGVHTKVIEDVQIVQNIPNKKRVIAIYFGAGLVIVFGIIFILDYLDNTIKERCDLEKILKTPVIGSLPFEKSIKETESFIVKDKPSSISSEVYRKLRTSFEYASIDKKVKTLVITSAEASEGKSTVCGNFAYIMSKCSKKVLIIDCDLRKPSIHRKFKIPNGIGLTGCLIGKVKLSEAVQKVDNNMYVLTSGEIPPNPSEILSSNKMMDFIKEVEEYYDLIIFDTPPLMAVTDGQVLAGKVDGTLYVVRASKTKANSIIKGFNELEIVKANILGSILNCDEISRSNYYYNYSSKNFKR